MESRVCKENSNQQTVKGMFPEHFFRQSKCHDMTGDDAGLGARIGQVSPVKRIV